MSTKKCVACGGVAHFFESGRHRYYECVDCGEIRDKPPSPLAPEPEAGIDHVADFYSRPTTPVGSQVAGERPALERLYRQALEKIWSITKTPMTKDEWISEMLSIAHDAMMVGNIAIENPEMLKTIVDEMTAIQEQTNEGELK
jgi:hypothetical protein